jgi:branched-subunit amino acid permease
MATKKDKWDYLIYTFCFFFLIILICQFSNIISNEKAHIGVLLLCELFLLITLTILFINWVKKDDQKYYLEDKE